MKSSEYFTSHFRLSHYPVLLLFFILSSYPASFQLKIFEVERVALDVTNTFNSCWNWPWSSEFHKQFYLHKLFTTHFIFYLFRILHPVTYSTYLPLFHLFSFFQQSNDKTQVLLFPPKVLCFYVLGCIVHVSNHLNIPHTPNPLFPSNFLLFFPNTFPKLVQILHCFMYHKPRQFRPSLSPSSSSFSSHTPYQFASKMLCNAIHASFSTKKCT